MITEVAVTNPTAKPAPKRNELRDLLEKSKSSLAAVLPKHLTPDRLMKLALYARSTSPDLQKCAPQSILQALMQAATLGLEPNTPLGEGWLIPRKNKKTGQMEASFQLGYQGMISLARRSGQIAKLEAHVVYEHDTFDLEYGLDQKLSHRPYFLCGKLEPGRVICAYAVAKLTDGSVQIEVMSLRDLERIRARSAASDGPWNTDTDEMYRKTLVRRIFKYLPKSAEIREVLEREADNDNGITADFEVVREATVEDMPEEKPQSRADAIKAQLESRTASNTVISDQLRDSAPTEQAPATIGADE